MMAQRPSFPSSSAILSPSFQLNAFRSPPHTAPLSPPVPTFSAVSSHQQYPQMVVTVNSTAVGTTQSSSRGATAAIARSEDIYHPLTAIAAEDDTFGPKKVTAASDGPSPLIDQSMWNLRSAESTTNSLDTTLSHGWPVSNSTSARASLSRIAISRHRSSPLVDATSWDDAESPQSLRTLSSISPEFDRSAFPVRNSLPDVLGSLSGGAIHRTVRDFSNAGDIDPVPTAVNPSFGYDHDRASKFCARLAPSAMLDATSVVPLRHSVCVPGQGSAIGTMDSVLVGATGIDNGQTPGPLTSTMFSSQTAATGGTPDILDKIQRSPSATPIGAGRSTPSHKATPAANTGTERSVWAQSNSLSFEFDNLDLLSRSPGAQSAVPMPAHRWDTLRELNREAKLEEEAESTTSVAVPAVSGAPGPLSLDTQTLPLATTTQPRQLPRFQTSANDQCQLGTSPLQPQYTHYAHMDPTGVTLSILRRHSLTVTPGLSHTAAWGRSPAHTAALPGSGVSSVSSQAMHLPSPMTPSAVSVGGAVSPMDTAAAAVTSTIRSMPGPIAPLTINTSHYHNPFIASLGATPESAGSLGQQQPSQQQQHHHHMSYTPNLVGGSESSCNSALPYVMPRRQSQPIIRSMSGMIVPMPPGHLPQFVQGSRKAVPQRPQMPQTRKSTESGKGMAVPLLPKDARIYIVKFKGCRKELFYAINDGKSPPTVPNVMGPVLCAAEKLPPGTPVIVEADRGEDLGFILDECTDAAKLAAFQSQRDGEDLGVPASAMGCPQMPITTGPKEKLNIRDISNVSGKKPTASSAPSSATVSDISFKDIFVKGIHRVATRMEVEKMEEKLQDEVKALGMCQGMVKNRNLPMEVVDAEFQWDRRKLTFYFVSEKRIDFRELVRDLFKTYKTRIWMCAVSNKDDGSMDGSNGGGEAAVALLRSPSLAQPQKRK